ncbi:hypothetical protein BG004_002959, partial [Podila humilis]
NVYCLDRDGKTRTIPIDPTEYRFKQALTKRNYDEVLQIIRNSNLVGQSIIAYLQKKGYPEIALHFVREDKTRFELALECGNIEVGLETAKAMDKEECWVKLAQEALRQGNHQIVEMCYQRIKNFDRLSFLYLATGNTDKLAKMLKIAELRGDYMSRFHNSLFLGNVEERVRLLREVGQAPLAYMTARTHGMHDVAEEILESSGLTPEDVADLPTQGTLLVPPQPLMRVHDSNWPQLAVSRNYFEAAFTGDMEGVAPQAPIVSHDPEPQVDQWGMDDEFSIQAVEHKGASLSLHAADTLDVDGDGGWDMDDDLAAELHAETGAIVAESSGLTIPVAGQSEGEVWCQNSPLAADHVAAGAFESAMQLLNRQVGAVNFEPLKDHFLAIFQASRAILTGNEGMPSIMVPIRRNPNETDQRKALPVLSKNFQSLIGNELQEAYKSTTANKLTEACTLFRGILHSLLLTVVTSSSEAEEVLQLVGVCREYLLGLSIELTRREGQTDTSPEGIKRMLELAAYFTGAQLQPKHMIISLRTAMTACYKHRNLQSAQTFARRLLELAPPGQAATLARQIQQVAQANPRDEVQLDYDQYNSFVVCGISYTPIYRGSPSVQCPYCRAHYKPEFQGNLCTICDISQIGGTGTVNFTTQHAAVLTSLELSHTVDRTFSRAVPLPWLFVYPDIFSSENNDNHEVDRTRCSVAPITAPHKADIAIKNSRNIGIIAHIDAGKTTTTERILHYAGFTRKIGDVDSGDTIMDYMKQERERGITITSAAITFGWRDHRINLIDTPGHVDFTIEVERSIRVLDGAVTILDAVAGVEAQTETVWQQAARQGIPRIAFVNKMDRAGAGFGRTVREMRSRLGCRPVVVQIPLMEVPKNENGSCSTTGNNNTNEQIFNGVVDVLSMEVLRWDSDPKGAKISKENLDSSYPDKELYQEAVKARVALVEQLSALDEHIIELFLTLEDHMAIEAKDLQAAIRRLTLSSTIVPVLCGASFRNIGVQPLMDSVVDYLPSPEERPAALGRMADGKLIEIGHGGVKERLCALAFKVVHDARRGPMVFVRVYGGQLNERAQLWNSTTHSKERANKLLQMYAMDVEEIPHITKGNIGVILGLKDTRTGDTLLDAHDPRKGLALTGIKVPSPVFFASVEPMSTSDEKPVEEAIKALIREDPSLGVRVDEETGQTLLGGMGELHLEVAIERLVSDFKVKAEMGRMRISFKETMRGAGVVSEVPSWEYDREVLGKRGRAKVGVSVERVERVMEDADESANVVIDTATSSSQPTNNKSGKKGKAADSLHTGPEEYDGNEIIIMLSEQTAATDEAGAQAALERAMISGAVVSSGSTDLPIPVLRTAVKNGICSALSRGPLLGFAQTHLRVRLTDLHLYGGESTPAAISSCVSGAVTEAIRLGGGQVATESNSVLLEPIMNVRVEVAEKDVGNVIGDISGTRRGRVLSLDGQTSESEEDADESEFQLYAPPDPTYTMPGSSSISSSGSMPGMADRKSIQAQVPLSSMLGYDAALRALTGGTGKFSMEVIGYGEMDFDRQREVMKEMRGG